MALFFGGLMRVRFMLLTRHSDEEISDFLNREVDKGYVLSKNRGNFFYFKKTDKKRRMAAYSFLSRSPDTSTEIELRKELPYLRKNGWDMVDIGGPEDIADSRRHAFLVEEKDGSEIPEAEDLAKEKAIKRRRRKIVSNLLLALIYLMFLSFLLFTDLPRISSSNLYSFFGIAIFILFIASFALSALALIFNVKYRKTFNKHYRYLDRSTLLTSITLFLILLFLVFDFLWGTSSHGVKTEINGRTYTLYNDDIPVTLKDLGRGEGEYKNSKHSESESIFAEYSYSYEQYLGSNAAKEDFISYTQYSSRSGLLLSITKKELMGKPGLRDESLSSALSANVVKSKNKLEVLIETSDRLLLIKSLVPLNDEVVIKIAQFL